VFTPFNARALASGLVEEDFDIFDYIDFSSTDGAANMLKLSRLLVGPYGLLRCLIHLFNLALIDWMLSIPWLTELVGVLKVCVVFLDLFVGWWLVILLVVVVVGLFAMLV